MGQIPLTLKNRSAEIEFNHVDNESELDITIIGLNSDAFYCCTRTNAIQIINHLTQQFNITKTELE